AHFRGNDRVPRVLHHEHPVAHADGQRAAAAAFAGDDADDGNFQKRHLPNILRDGDALTALLRLDARIRAYHVDQGDDGPAKLFGLMHEAHRFAVTFGVGQTEVAANVFFRIAAFLRPDDGDGDAVQHGDAAHHGLVVSHAAVAVQLHEVFKNEIDVIQRRGAL